MKKIAEMISYLSLALLVAAPSLFYAGKISLDTNKLLLLAATIVWFATAICWMGKDKESAL